MSFKNTTKKIISTLLIIFIIMPSFLFLKIKKAEAIPVFDTPQTVLKAVGNVFLGTSATAQTTQTAFSAKEFAISIAKQITMTITRRLLQQMTLQTINWINSGFHGKPLFLKDPDGFFRDIAKYEIKTFIDTFGYNPNLYPFGKQMALNVISSYKTQFEENAQYTLSKVINDPALLERYRNDFNLGGWDGFLINTQYEQNNPLGYQIMTSDYLARKLQGTINNNAQKIENKLQQGMGFLSPQTCPSNPNYNTLQNQFNTPKFKSTIKYNPPTERYITLPSTDYTSEEYLQGNINGSSTQILDPEYIKEKEDYDANHKYELEQERAEWGAVNDCPKGLVTTTPGSVVASEIMNAMSSKIRQSELGAAMGNSISAILDALLNKFTKDGLTGLASNINPKKEVEDNWNYEGQTLGSPVDEDGNTTWNVGPDQPIVLDKFKKDIEKDLNNTDQEIELINGVIGYMSRIWPQTRNLDLCQPGPDFGWKDRMTNEMNRNSKKLQENINKDSGEKAAQADLALKELKFAVNFFTDWINNNMMTELPNSVIFMDAIDEIEDLSQESKELIDKKRNRTQANARLESIRTALEQFTEQPEIGSGQEKILISLMKQYNATKNNVANNFTLDEIRNQFKIAEEKLERLNKLVLQCNNERKEKGWSLPGGPISTFNTGTTNNTPSIGNSSNNTNTEKNIYCDAPIKGGYNHESFDHKNDDPGRGILGAVIGGYLTLGVGTAVGGIAGQASGSDGNPITHPEIPYVNAKRVLTWRGTLGLIGHSASIKMECNIIWKANILDYKGDLPGETNYAEIYKELPSENIGIETGACTVMNNNVTPPEEYTEQGVTETDCMINNGINWVPDFVPGTIETSTP